MPESVTDRPTKSHEYIFMLTKSARYYYDADAVKEKASGRSFGNRQYKYDGVLGMETKQGILAVADKPYYIRNIRTVWTIPTQAFTGAHFAVFPSEIPRRCILASTRENDLVLDPFAGSGTTGAVALSLHRRFIGIELNPDYIAMITRRMADKETLT
jgi:DNA modification methylase